MLNFDEYVMQMEERRAREKRADLNAALSQGLREKTHAQAVAELYAGLTFVVGVSDVLPPVGAENRLQPVF